MTTTLLSIVLSCITAPQVETSAEPQSLLYIRTTPAGAQILLDGKPLGTSDGLFPIKPGSYKIIIDLQGHQPKEQNITVRDGRITRIELQLDKRTVAKPTPQEARPTPADAPQMLIERAGERYKVQLRLGDQVSRELLVVPSERTTFRIDEEGDGKINFFKHTWKGPHYPLIGERGGGLKTGWLQMTVEPGEWAEFVKLDASLKLPTGMARQDWKPEYQQWRLGEWRSLKKGLTYAGASSPPPGYAQSMPSTNWKYGDGLPWTDLLSQVDLNRDIIRGQWVRNDEAIVVTPTEKDRQHLRLQLPVMVEGGYDLEMEFTRNEGDETVGAVLPVGAGGCVLHLSAFGGRVSGLDMVEGRGIGTPGKSDDSWPGTLTNGHHYKLLVSVRLSGENATVDATLDGKPCVKWTGKQSALHVWSGWALKGYRQLGLVANESTVTFHKVRVRPVAGRVIPVLEGTRREEPIPHNQWVDLLEPIYLPADAVRGKWVGDEDGLIVSPPSSGETYASLMLPAIVEGSYDFEVEFTRINHDDSILIGLPTGSRACTFHLSSWNGNVGGLEMIDGMAVGVVGNPTTIRPNSLTNGRRYKVLAKVRTDGDEVSIEVTATDQPPIKWKGKQSSLGVWGSWNDMNLKRPALGTNGNIVRFHSARLRPISGKATLLRTVTVGYNR